MEYSRKHELRFLLDSVHSIAVALLLPYVLIRSRTDSSLLQGNVASFSSMKPMVSLYKHSRG